MMTFRKALPLLLSFSLIVPAIATTSTSPGFHIRDQWKLGGEGGWGYLTVDPAAHRLYIPRGNRIMVVDTQTGKLSGTIDGLVDAIDLALDDTGRFGYATDMTTGSEGFVRVFDRTTLKLMTSIAVGVNPTAILFDHATKSVVSLNTRDRSATIIDSATNQITATINLPGHPSAAVTDDNGTVFVTLPATGELARIDLAQRKLTTALPLAPCSGSAQLAIDRVHRQLFTTCDDHSLIAVNADTGHVTPLGPISATPGDLRYDAKSNLLFLADTTGKLTIFERSSPTHLVRLQQLSTQQGARTMIVDAQTDRAYLVTAQYGQNPDPNVSEELRFRPTPVAGTFAVIVVAH